MHADEHFLERNGFLTCAAAPIHAPDGHLLGALDVSGDYRGYHRHTLGLVRSAARMIEHRLFETKHDFRQWAGLRLHLHAQPEGLGTMTEGLLAVRLSNQRFDAMILDQMIAGNGVEEQFVIWAGCRSRRFWWSHWIGCAIGASGRARFHGSCIR